MASRPSPLSLKARAIALLAQREHSVAELRRKLLRLAQLRDLQAWQDQRLPTAGAASLEDDAASLAFRALQPATQPADRRVAAEVQALAARSGIGSFDLDEDWAEGELEAFMDEWGLEDPGPDRGRDGIRPAMRGGPACAEPGAEPGGGPVQPAPGHPQASCGASSAARARRRPERSRPAAPSAEALGAVMEEAAQQARAEEVEQLLQWLQQRGYLSEARLVESRINARASRYGNLRIQQELRQLGVAPDEAQQARLKDSELERAREVWRRKFGGELPSDAAARAKQMRFLAARGFSSEVVRRVLRGEDD